MTDGWHRWVQWITHVVCGLLCLIHVKNDVIRTQPSYYTVYGV